MNKNELIEIMYKIDRPFLSEMDFQFWFIKELEKKYKEAIVIPEYPYIRNLRSKNQYLDIFVKDKGIRYGIELKYKTRKQMVSIGGYFKGELKEQGANDLSRYDYLWDINRLEYMIENKMVEKGFTIILSNDERIWSAPSRDSVMDVSTRFYNVDKSLKNIPGTVMIDSIAGKKSIPFPIKGTYTVPKIKLDISDIGIDYHYSINEIK